MDFEIVEDISEVEEIEEDSSFSLTSTIIEEEPDDVILLHCDYCGSCVDPDTCVFSIVCPKCNSPQRELCREREAGNKLVGLHEERWRAAKGREYAWR